MRTNATLIALAAAGFVSGANMRLFDALLPTVADEFGVVPAVASIVVTAFALAYGLFQLVHGPLGDRGATFIAAAMSLATVFVTSLGALAALRFLTGVGVGGMIPLALAWIGDNTPYEKRQATLARFLGVVLLGNILGPAMGGVLAELLSWRAVFLIFTLLFLAVGFVLLAQQRRTPPPVPSAEPRPGVVRGYIEVLRDPWVRTVLATVAIEGALFYGAFTYTGAFLKEKFDLPYSTIGAVIAAFGVGGVLYSLMVRWLVRRLGESGLVITGGFVLLGCYLLLPFLPGWQPIALVLVGCGIGFYMFHNTIQTRSTEMAPKARGTALALHAFSMFFGQAIGVAVCGLSIRVLHYEWTYVLAGLGLAMLGMVFRKRILRHAETVRLTKI
jgi:predicted MFS family arabinose efflux permease